MLRGARRLDGLTMGLVGADAVAVAVARRAAAFGMRPAFYSGATTSEGVQTLNPKTHAL